jgi:hypothetical protein
MKQHKIISKNKKKNVSNVAKVLGYQVMFVKGKNLVKIKMILDYKQVNNLYSTLKLTNRCQQSLLLKTETINRVYSTLVQLSQLYQDEQFQKLNKPTTTKIKIANGGSLECNLTEKV